MCTHINLKVATVFKGIFFALLFSWNMLSGQNVALDFDGDNDFITLNPIANLPGSSDFTVEMWFKCNSTGGGGNNCSGDFRRLFGLGAAGPNRFEVGECGGILSVYLSGPGVVQSSINVRDGNWHCIAATKSNGIIDIYYDGSPVPGISSLPGGSLVVSLFRLGHWPGGGNTPGQDWQGLIDEVKIWNTALAPGAITACSACVLTGSEPGLVAYWRFDEGTPNGPNTGPVKDFSSAGANPGVFYAGPSTPAPFALSGNVSNYVPSNAPILYPEYTNLQLELTDPVNNTTVQAICEGDPVHFAIVDGNGIPVSGNALASVQWQYSDDCVNWSTPVNIPPVGSPSALFSGFSFVSIPNHPALLCPSGQPNGFVDRCYRAIITVNNGINSCSYIVQPAQLHICCKLPPMTLTVTPPGPLCEGDVWAFQAMVSGIPAPSLSNNYHVSWSVTINNVTTPLSGSGYDDLLSITYPQSGAITLVPGTYCIKAIVSNCICPSVTLQHCFTVDPKPVCGTIKPSPIPATLSPDPDGIAGHYVICPGDDAALMIDLPFTNCNPVWQYMFTNFPGTPAWNDLGSSNGTQNTNVLPHDHPAGSPYLWPTAETCIEYRIECRPYSYPNSGCPPCLSNVIRICLKQAPATPVIVASATTICKNGSATLSIQTPVSGITYDWYCNGLYYGSGININVSQNACYWVVASETPSCLTSTSSKVCITVCEAVAIISCPNPICPCVGDPITIDGLNSYSTCGGPLTYFWSWVDNTGTPQTATTAAITDIPVPTGTTYTLTVTDQNGCTDSIQATIVPCSN